MKKGKPNKSLRSKVEKKRLRQGGGGGSVAAVNRCPAELVSTRRVPPCRGRRHHPDVAADYS
jgi:hypothetical protein